MGVTDLSRLPGRAPPARPRQPEHRPASLGGARPLPLPPRRRARAARSDRSTWTARARRGGCRAPCRWRDAAALVEAPDTTPAGRAARPRAARAALRLRAPRLRGPRPADRGRQLQGGLRDRAPGKGSRQRLVPAGAQALDWVRQYLDDASGPARCGASARRSSSIGRAGPCRGRRLWGLIRARGAARGAPRRGLAAHPAPLLREPPARARRRPALGAGHARPRGHLDHADLHAPAVERRPRHVPEVPPAGGARARSRARAASSERAEMAKAGHAYPQVEPGVAALMDARVVTRRARGAVARALRPRAGAPARRWSPSARGRAARVVGAGAGAAWGLAGVPARDVAWRDLPSVSAGRLRDRRARRRLLAGAPLVLVRRRPRVIGVVDRDRVDLTPPESSLLARLEHARQRGRTRCPPRGSAGAISGPPQLKQSRVWLLRVAGKIGEGLGAPAYAVGGFVRDLLTGAGAARRGSRRRGRRRRLRAAARRGDRRHACSCTGASAPRPSRAGRAPAGAGLDGVALGRVDVASARRERYRGGRGAARGRAGGSAARTCAVATSR